MHRWCGNNRLTNIVTGNDESLASPRRGDAIARWTDVDVGGGRLSCDKAPKCVVGNRACFQVVAQPRALCGIGQQRYVHSIPVIETQSAVNSAVSPPRLPAEACETAARMHS